MKIFLRVIILPLILVPVSFILEGIVLSVPAYFVGYKNPWSEYGLSGSNAPDFIETVLMFTVAVPFYRSLLINGITLFVCLVVFLWNRGLIRFTVKNWLALWVTFYSNLAIALLIVRIGSVEGSAYPWVGYKLMIYADWAAFIPATAISSATALLVLDRLSRVKNSG